MHRQLLCDISTLLLCVGDVTEVPVHWGVHEDVYCAGKETTFQFLEGVLKEVISLFPSQYIHIGGDEVIPCLCWQSTHLSVLALLASIMLLASSSQRQSYQIRHGLLAEPGNVLLPALLASQALYTKHIMRYAVAGINLLPASSSQHCSITRQVFAVPGST